MVDVDAQGRTEPPLAGDETATLVGFPDDHRHDGHADPLREAIDGQTGE